MDGLTIAQISQIGAWGLALGTLFFGLLGIRADKDFFLMLGNVCCVMGNIGFALFLNDQEGENGNETWITVYILLALLSCYAIYVQWHLWREEGCGDDEEEEEEEEAGPAKPTATAVAEQNKINQQLFQQAAADADTAASSGSNKDGVPRLRNKAS